MARVRVTILARQFPAGEVLHRLDLAVQEPSQFRRKGPGLSSALDAAIMPTILHLRGWRVFFYSDEGNEPLHVHARKADAECKFWLHQDLFDIEEVWSHGLTPRLRREIRKIIYDNFEVIAEEWT